MFHNYAHTAHLLCSLVESVKLALFCPVLVNLSIEVTCVVIGCPVHSGEWYGNWPLTVPVSDALPKFYVA